jgi:16S rRNA (cytosine967-C5)-methyltransferase
VVDQTVTAAAHPDTARAKGMVNAVLRRFLRERKALLDAALLQPVAKWNYPQWWIDAVKTAWPQDWQGVLATGNSAPPLTLRINARKTSVEQYLAKLAEAGMAASQIGPYAVRLAKPVGVHLIPGFAEGLVSVQDAGAQLAAPLLDVQDGMRVLDACAAPGGKTCHILELADARVTALDADPKRLARVGENLTACNCKPPSRRPTPRIKTGGTANSSTASWPTCRAPPPASCAATRISAGCAARPTRSNLQHFPAKSSTTFGRCWHRVVNCYS